MFTHNKIKKSVCIFFNLSEEKQIIKQSTISSQRPGHEQNKTLRKQDIIQYNQNIWTSIYLAAQIRNSSIINGITIPHVLRSAIATAFCGSWCTVSYKDIYECNVILHSLSCIT